MIGLDTNVLVRLFVRDDPAQTAQVQGFLATRCTAESPGFINCIVLAEFVWVLRRQGYGRSEIGNAVEKLLSGNDRLLERRDDVVAALADHRAGRGDLIDLLIGRINRSHGCEATATFDQKAAKLENFTGVA
jgi:predicted nucleic-acid-binding protein